MYVISILYVCVYVALNHILLFILRSSSTQTLFFKVALSVFPISASCFRSFFVAWGRLGKVKRESVCVCSCVENKEHKLQSGARSIWNITIFYYSTNSITRWDELSSSSN